MNRFLLIPADAVAGPELILSDGTLPPALIIVIALIILVTVLILVSMKKRRHNDAGQPGEEEKGKEKEGPLS